MGFILARPAAYSANNVPTILYSPANLNVPLPTAKSDALDNYLSATENCPAEKQVTSRSLLAQ
jgi:hypothetical protein